MATCPARFLSEQRQNALNGKSERMKSQQAKSDKRAVGDVGHQSSLNTCEAQPTKLASKVDFPPPFPLSSSTSFLSFFLLLLLLLLRQFVFIFLIVFSLYLSFFFLTPKPTEQICLFCFFTFLTSCDPSQQKPCLQ